jgi:hypothetical protein
MKFQQSESGTQPDVPPGSVDRIDFSHPETTKYRDKLPESSSRACLVHALGTLFIRKNLIKH